MTVSTTRARHRAARRPSTPLTELAAAAIGPDGHRRTPYRCRRRIVGTRRLDARLARQRRTAGDGRRPARRRHRCADRLGARRARTPPRSSRAPVDAAWTFDVPAVTAETPAAARRRPSRPRPRPPSRSTARAAAATTTAPPPQPPTPPSRSRSPATRSSRSPPATSARRTSPVARTPGRLRLLGLRRPTSTRSSASRLPRTSSGIKAAGTVISRADAQPGDLIWSPGHISIYAGGNDADRLAPPGQDDPVPRHLAELAGLHPDRLTLSRSARRGPDDSDVVGASSRSPARCPVPTGRAYSGRAPRCCFASPGRQPAGPTPEVGRTPCS